MHGRSERACIVRVCVCVCVCVQLHIVHWNTELCCNVDEAIKSATGVAVLGVFFQVRLPACLPGLGLLIS